MTLHWPWESEFWEENVPDIPILGPVVKVGYDIAKNVLGGATGESDIGMTDFEGQSYPVNPAAFISPSTQGYTTIDPSAHPLVQDFWAKQEAYNQAFEVFAADWRQKHNGEQPGPMNLWDSDWPNKREIISLSNALKDTLTRAKEAGVEIPRDKPTVRMPSMRDLLMEGAIAPGSDRSWLREGATTPENLQWLKSGTSMPGTDEWLLDDYRAAGQMTAPQMSGFTPMEYSQQYMGDEAGYVELDPRLMSQYRGLEGMSRGEQMSALDAMRSAAMGEAPSRAEILMDIGVEDASQAAMAQAGAARGGAGAVLQAQRLAMMQGAGLQQANIREKAALRAGEMETARQGYMQGATGLRSTDQVSVQTAMEQVRIQAQLEQDALLQTSAQRQAAGMLGEEQHWKTGALNLETQTQRELANLDAKLKTMGYNQQDRLNALNAYMQNKGLDQERRQMYMSAYTQGQANDTNKQAMYMDAFLKERGYDLAERQTYISGVLGIDASTLSANMGLESMKQQGSQFTQQMAANIAQANAAAQSQNFAGTLNAISAGVGYAAGGGGGSGGGMPNFSGTSAPAANPQAQNPTFFEPPGLTQQNKTKIIDPWEN